VPGDEMSKKTIEFTESVDELVPVEIIHEIYVAHVLRVVGGNKSHAARILQIDRRTLYRRLDSIARRAQGLPIASSSDGEPEAEGEE
jgi:DNA-binding NtrC family response regulator